MLKPALGEAAVISTPSVASCEVSCGVGWPGMTVVYELPFLNVPLADVLPVFEPNVTVLILCAPVSEMNCE